MEVVISEPLLDGNHELILPQGSRLSGTVSQVQPARRMKKNGQLRIRFQELTPAGWDSGKGRSDLGRRAIGQGR